MAAVPYSAVHVPSSPTRRSRSRPAPEAQGTPNISSDHADDEIDADNYDQSPRGGEESADLYDRAVAIVLRDRKPRQLYSAASRDRYNRALR